MYLFVLRNVYSSSSSSIPTLCRVLFGTLLYMYNELISGPAVLPARYGEGRVGGEGCGENAEHGSFRRKASEVGDQYQQGCVYERRCFFGGGRRRRVVVFFHVQGVTVRIVVLKGVTPKRPLSFYMTCAILTKCVC